MSADQVLVGRNNTRRAYNMRVRQRQNIEDPLPVAGDKLVCLRNNRKKALFNGGLGGGGGGDPTATQSRRPRIPLGAAGGCGAPRGRKTAGGGGFLGGGAAGTAG